MSEQYPGGFISKTEPTVNGSVARGMWTLSQAAGYAKQGLWPTVPAAPTIGTATAGDASASVAFTAPSNIGSSAITSYTATSSPGGLTGTGASSPVTVSGLTNGTAYTFTVTATNGAGTSPASAASNSITPAQINYIEDVFSTYLYTGVPGGAVTVTNEIDLSGKGGLVWVKRTNGNTNHLLADTLRGGGNMLQSNTTDASSYQTDGAVTFNSNGFTTGSAPSAPFVSWTFREQAKFFDIVTYTGNGVNNRAISHNLGSVPGFIIIKSSTNSTDWVTYHRSYTFPNWIRLNSTDAESTTYGNAWGAVPTSTTFTTGSGGFGDVNYSGRTYVAYLFAHDAGGFGLSGTDSVITCDSFTTNAFGAPTTNVGTTFFDSQWVMIKRIDNSSNWMTVDDMRGFTADSSGGGYELRPNSVVAQSLENLVKANGKSTTSTNITPFGSSYANGTFIYIAIRRGPMKIPTVGTSVYDAKLYTGAGTNPVTISGISMVPDFAQNFSRNPSTGQGAIWWDRLRGGTVNLEPRSLGGENTQTAATATFDKMTTVTLSGGDVNATSYPFVNHFFKRAPSFFDEVCYTGTGSTLVLNHNLSVAPELIIGKRRAGSSYWILSGNFGASTYWYKNDWGGNDSSTSSSYSGGLSFGAQPTSTTVTLDNNSALNINNNTGALWMWATCPGVSKVGTYTGTGATQTIACGFAAGARFVLITRVGVVGSNDTYIWDSVRGMVAGTDPSVLLNSGAAEVNTNSVYAITTGFQIVSTAAGINASGGSYIFLAIA